MELADILSQDSIIACAKVASKRQLLQLLADRASELVGIDAQVIFETLQNREQLGSTGLGNGIAIPHGKIKGLPSVTAVFARLAQPIDFDAVDDQPVDLVVMLLAPEGSGADHLKALSRVARLLRADGVVDRLRATKDETKLRDILTTPAEAINAA
ncbi:PTS IIA-like nitrogen regulatory protein PtsN [Pelagibacterium halotolerans]|uniref:PTS system nitrogen-specific IIA component, PtsN n=1 Tax=Pelagibacterium halotolerans (strain DSM 22347 / JCM 15775 / CGMCC 1.7692 / B2) TaxID=1082931 RepID=G4R9A9_PELHB|nr:PTS IIA-like nitrogen regulatory protein PtsN [Pelagibacterium halotolerans]AEQ53443.1 PTS system nitrogen-specific IIA component, PtsN [Pelagibacterium halotolerans B2]QJR20376.1 PTS IIA-like nitrogen regulatory protein PtsN [Pelagibacterium halotolerans]SEA60221.1 PTS IIA-like nitrogen-regulatory protein PtsN [Pelagibacterium halotolerans]